MKKRISIVLVLAFGLASVSLAAEGTWTKKADMPTRREVVSSSVVDGKIYAIGGSPGSACLSTVEAYDPLTNAWTRKADMPIVNGAAATSVVNGKVYVIGGTSRFMGAPYSSVIEYDATTDTWAAKADMPTARTYLSSSVVNGKIYAIGGGLTYQGTPLSTVEEYDPATDTWTSKADMPTPRAFVSTSAVNGKIYAIGGNLSDPWYRGLTTVEEYDPATDTWTKKADMPTARTYFSTCAVNGKIYAIGGVKSGEADYVSQVEEYDPATDTWTWTRKADMPSARLGLAASAVNGKIYAIGGWGSGGGALSTVEEYDPGLTVSSPDFNGDGIVDSTDMCVMVDHWHTDNALYDIAPAPFGDGIVDVQDLIVLADLLFQKIDDSTLVAHWALDETEGMVVADSAGENSGYALGDPMWQPDGGLVDGALQLDGVDDFISAPAVLNPADPEISSGFSVLAWVKGGAPGQAIISEPSGPDWLSLDPLTGCLMTELTNSGQSGGPLSSETATDDGNWHRIGLVWDGSHITLYVDGIAVAQDTPDGLANSSNGLNIGCGPTFESNSFFSGMVDDVRIYNRAVKP